MGEFVLSHATSANDSVRLLSDELAGLSLTADQSRLLVCDNDHACVMVFDAHTGEFLRRLKGPDPGRDGTLWGARQAVAVPLTGEVLVLDPLGCRVVVFPGVDDDTMVRTLKTWNEGQGPLQLDDPCDLAVLDGDVADAAAPDGPVAVVVDWGNDRLVLWRVRDGTEVRHVGSQGAAPGQFACPTAVTVVPARSTGNDEAWLVVADSGNRRVQVLTRAGTVVRVLQGDAVIKLGRTLYGVTVCIGTGEVLVTDKDRVVSWRLSDGGGLRVVCGGVEGSEPGQLSYPKGVVALGDGPLWVAEEGNHRLSLFH